MFLRCSIAPPLIAFVSATDADRARHFYRDILRLRLVSESPFALEFDCAGTMLRVTLVDKSDAGALYCPRVAGAGYCKMVRSLAKMPAISVEKLRGHGSIRRRHLDGAERSEGRLVQGSGREPAIGQRILKPSVRTIQHG